MERVKEGLLSLLFLAGAHFVGCRRFGLLHRSDLFGDDSVMSKKKTHLDDFVEWQNHQYDPGYYTGSKMHPFIEATGKPRRLAVWWFIQSGIFAVIYFIVIFQAIKGRASASWGDRSLSKAEMVLFWSLFLGPLFAFSLLIGIRYWQRAKKKVHSSGKKRKHHSSSHSRSLPKKRK